MANLLTAICVAFLGFVVYSLFDHSNQLKRNTEEISRLRKENHNLQIHEYILNDLKSQVQGLREENGHFRKEIDRLNHQRELTKDRLEALKDEVRKRDEALKEFDKGVNIMHEELKNTVKELDKLVNHVTNMDKMMEKLDHKYVSAMNELNDIKGKLNQDRNHYHKHEHEYSSGGTILGAIRYTINVIANKLLGFALGGISSVLLLN
ncbi:uncharacterized protein LOC134275295 [Saccostrea cucullata]|uniref:uncharacterized protein LOC134275295 n=1 Tax=Saccostrea cuccullata TaxID=36930 RepID=UPI002ED1D4E0